MGGGGANLLDSPKTGDNSGFEDLETDEKSEEEYIVTYKTYDDYFTDLNITKETITEADLTGTGSANNPYIVRSTKGFLWLTNSGLSGIFSLYAKHINLACDVILNDETFDENGTPSGGDGVVYSWTTNVSASDIILDGRGFNILGAYNNNNEISQLCMFYGVPAKIMNLNFVNVFFQGKNVPFMAPNIKVLENVNTYKGTIKATGSASAFVQNANLLENCSNGFYVYTTNHYCGGFITRTDSLKKHTILRNCRNYGKIEGYGVVGGFVGSTYQSNCDFYDCCNYGEVINTGGSSIGGFAGVVAGKTIIMNCKNYGAIYRKGGISTSGVFVGQYLNSYLNNDSYATRLIIKNCYIELDYQNSVCSLIFGNASKRNDRIFDLYVENVNYNIKNLDRKIYLFTAENDNLTSCEIKNINLELHIVGSGALGITNNVQTNIVINNLLISGNINEEVVLYVTDNNKTAQQMDIKSFVINGKGIKQFYGTDFSGFYCDWKSGKIGLKALNGKGFYQGEVNEEVLANKGFVKKEIA